MTKNGPFLVTKNGLFFLDKNSTEKKKHKKKALRGAP